ncbi:hypothetical protein [Vreelandella sulfidaeris]|uniref:Uncharacterized protein n=1 Tax=Vreelandella sulfidaeris TaxID=115553 RepID=A0A455UB45_9GAMM|nr:hypothetical protein HSBAA_30650 [Halomonas sulfidaeris]
MSKTKQLTASQLAGLQRMKDGPCDYFDLIKVGANGSTIKSLCNNGLANVCYPETGKAWQITHLGKKALEAGHFDLDGEATQGTESCVAAIKFALETDDGLAFLRCWYEADFDDIRRDWPEAPEEVFIGADPLYRSA